MEAAQLEQLVHEIINQQILQTIPYWVGFGFCTLVVNAVASLLGSYFSKRGELQAAHHERQKILDQLVANTQATETIKSIVSLAEWSERERRQLLRAKLEDLLVAAHRADDWLDTERLRLFFLADIPESISPFATVMTLGRLFFPELKGELANFRNEYKGYEVALSEVYRTLISTKLKISKAVVAVPNWEAEFQSRVNEAQYQIREENTMVVMAKRRLATSALMALDDAAEPIMARLIAVPPASF